MSALANDSRPFKKWSEISPTRAAKEYIFYEKDIDMYILIYIMYIKIYMSINIFKV